MRFKDYQIDDLARLSLVNGAILSWQCGLGKTNAMYAWSLMKCGWTGKSNVSAPVLIISPEDLHKQTIDEGRKWFGVETRRLPAYLANVAPGFYIVSYSALRARNIPPEAFTCVVVDEGDKAKKGSSDAGKLVRKLNPKYRLICTATPMADRLPDLFWLCSWVTANDPKDARRWPYGASPVEYNRFAQRFLVESKSLSRSLGSGAPAATRSAEVSQLFLLWKLLSPIILRRTMEDTGEKIVKLHHQVVPCALGRRQRSNYERTLFDSAMDIGVRLGALRRIAGGAEWPNPKLARALELVSECMARGQQILIASEFRGPNDAIAERLTNAKIPFVIMDGRTDPFERGDLADQFRARQIPIALIGLKSGAEGQSYPKCNNVILLNYSWEYKKLPQVIHRARRINSEKDLNVYSLVAQGTIEHRMAQLIVDEKGASADLVLDVCWPSNRSTEASESLLDVATKEFQSTESVLEESEIEGTWPAIRQSLQESFRSWRRTLPNSGLSRAPANDSRSLIQEAERLQARLHSHVPAIAV